MAAITSLTELRNMPLTDLRREVRAQRLLVAKLRLGVHMQKEKDTARYQREKKQLARMLTILQEKQLAEAPVAAAEPTPTTSAK